MLVRPLPGIPRTRVRDALFQTETAASNAFGTHPGADLYNAYYEWAHTAAAELQGLVSAPDVDRLVLTPRHWALYAVPLPSARPVIDAVGVELRARIADLQTACETLDRLAKHWDEVNGSRFVVLDSNVYCEHPQRIDTLDFAGELGLGPRFVHLVVPMKVLDELDTQKDRGRDPARQNARKTIRILNHCLEDPSRIGEIQPERLQDDPARGRVTVELFADPLGRTPLPLDDDEIIDRALALQDLYGRPVTLMTGDVGMSTRARLAGLTVKLITWSR